MDSNVVILKSLCVYQDEAIGANPIPLSIIGQNTHIKKSSDYFAKSGIKIDLQLNNQGEILKIQLGSEISIDLQTMKAGLEVGPLGLFPVHVLQLAESFNSKEGGILRFGFLKKIFIKESLQFILRRGLAKLTGINFNRTFCAESDLSKACTKSFGLENWGTYDITVKKDQTGNWALYQTTNETSVRTISRLVARFKVNKAGVVLGIQQMYCQ